MSADLLSHWPERRPPRTTDGLGSVGLTALQVCQRCLLDLMADARDGLSGEEYAAFVDGLEAVRAREQARLINGAALRALREREP